MLKNQFGDFETKYRLELPLGILNSTYIRPVKTDHIIHLYYTVEELYHSLKRSRKKQQHSLRNEKHKTSRASVTEEQRRERLRIRRKKDRAKRTKNNYKR